MTPSFDEGHPETSRIENLRHRYEWSRMILLHYASPLKGVWYRTMFGHSGWCAILEDWFDPQRGMKDDYVPTGFKPYHAKTYAVKGHPFGLNLSDEDRRVLIAFLKTL
jgi:hypothetical protein